MRVDKQELCLEVFAHVATKYLEIYEGEAHSQPFHLI